jgi:hydroxymethylpyrimidine pyrophosphatase-like HAD family hydrolase
VTCVDVMPAGIDKGTGVRWLSEEVGIPLAGLGGIGDSTSDCKFLRLVGHPAAPANATAEVKASVRYVSPYEDGDGVVDILRHWCGQPIEKPG